MVLHKTCHLAGMSLASVREIFYPQFLKIQNQVGLTETIETAEKEGPGTHHLPGTYQEESPGLGNTLQIVKLSQHVLTPDGKRILEKGLTFSPMSTLDKF